MPVQLYWEGGEVDLKRLGKRLQKRKVVFTVRGGGGGGEWGFKVMRGVNEG